MDDQFGITQSSGGCWKPYMLQISNESLLLHDEVHVDDLRGSMQRCNLPFFQEWLELRRILRTADSTSDCHCEGSSFSFGTSEFGSTLSSNFRSCNASFYNLSDRMGKNRVDYKPACGAAQGNDTSLMSSVTSSATFVSLETAICPSERLKRTMDCDADSGHMIQANGTHQSCVGATLDRSSEIQKQVDSFCLESSKRIRDAILRRALPEKGTKITKSDATRDIEIPKPESMWRPSLLQDADDESSTNRAASRMDFQEDSLFRFTSHISVPDSLVHSYVNEFDPSVGRNVCHESMLSELERTISTIGPTSVSHAATQVPEPPSPVIDGKEFHLKFASRAEYAGELLDCLPHGVGRYFCSACSYRGEWLFGKPHGRGDYSWPDGDRYCGEFVDGTRSGYGIYYTWTGDKYAGTWINDELSGLGMCTQGDGRRLILSQSKTHRTLTPHGSMLCWPREDAVVCFRPLLCNTNFTF
jgi:hypothetical protein